MFLSIHVTHNVTPVSGGIFGNSKSVSVWTSNFCKPLENASVNGERFETKMPCSNVFIE